MNRITCKQLDGLCETINRMVGAPLTDYSKNDNGGFKANIGNHHISSAHGGYALHVIQNESGGVDRPWSHGYMPARELYGQIGAYIGGLQETKK